MGNILASAARTASGTAAIATAHVERLRGAKFQLTISTAANVAGDTLDVYVQSSSDNGTTYDDFIHFTQALGNGGAKKFIAQWIRDTVPTTPLHAPQDASLAAGVSQGPIGPLLQIKWVIVDGGAHGQSFTFALDMIGYK